MKGRGRISKNNFLFAKVGKRPSLKRQLSKLKKIREKREGVSCKICEKDVLNERGEFELGAVQTGSDDGKSIWSYHKNCYNKYKNHFCGGVEIWMKICKECQDEEKIIIKEFNKLEKQKAVEKK